MENRSGGWELLGGMAIGAVGGFLLGMTLAPKGGDETRDNLNGSLQDARQRTNDLLENFRGNTEALLNSTREAIEEKLQLLSEAVEEGRKAAEYKRAELIDREHP